VCSPTERRLAKFNGVKTIFVSLVCILIEPIALFSLTLATGNKLRSRDFEATPPADRLISPRAQKSICSRKVAV
jgi:hypothetical protein